MAVNQEVSFVYWNSTKEKLPKSRQEDMRNNIYDKAYLLWCKNDSGEQYVDPSTFVLEADHKDGKFIPIKWIGYQGGEFACERKLENVLYWAELPVVD